MSMTYKPSGGAAHDSFWGPIFLGVRDISGQAPIDKVSYPSVNVRAACSPDNIFDENEYQTCISNLLAAEFRRFILDLYWDPVSQNFNLCPVRLPYQNANTTSESVSATSTQPSLSMTTTMFSAAMLHRQANNVTASANSTSSHAPTSSTSPLPSTTNSAGSVLYHLGQYQCTQGLTLQSVRDLFNSYIENTSDPVLARLIVLELNLHAAATANNPDATAPVLSSAQMPSGSELAGNVIEGNGNLKRQLYTLPELLRDRSNLNASWFAVSSVNQLPRTYYFTTSKDSKGDLLTEDGWPNEMYLLFTRYARVLVSWGSIDEQMKNYTFDSDSSAIFPQGYLQEPHPFEESIAGVVKSGCFYTDQFTSAARVNATWAIGSVNNPQNAVQDVFVGNLTACGIAPNLNTSLTDFSAADNFTIYQRFTEGAVFGWATGEPRNTSSPGADRDGKSNQYRCVALDPSDAYRGRWRVADCQQNHRVACRINNQPFGWRISSDEVAYGDAPTACPSNTSFNLPMTGLENTYLYQHILQDMTTSEAIKTSALKGVWINLNSLDVQNCWVTTGPNGTCVYDQDQAQVHSRQILIPTIAALIVLCLTVVTIVIKCNNNVRHHRRSKTGPGGWEYEGVPS